jgi:hypothetical protein
LLADHMGLDPIYIAKLVRAVGSGLIERSLDDHDARAVRLTSRDTAGGLPTGRSGDRAQADEWDRLCSSAAPGNAGAPLEGSLPARGV